MSRHWLTRKKNRLTKANAKRKKHIAAVVAYTAKVKRDIDDGVIQLPDPGLGCVWTLHDSGSSINAADHSKHFPGADVDKTPVAGTYTNANGQPFTNKGKFGVDVKSENMHDRHLEFLDAPVSMPIHSSNLWAKNGFRNIIEDTFGTTIHIDSGDQDPLVVRNGVYVMQMNVPKSLRCQHIADTPFRRHGTA